MVLVYILGLILLLGFLVTSISGAPWVPARSFDLDALLDDSKLKPGQRLLELGCGDGRLLQAAAKRGIRATGYELNPLLWLIATLRLANTKGVRVRFGNFWTADISKADVVMAFLVPRTMPRLAEKAAAELKPGALLISYIFPIEGKKPLLHNRSWFVYSFTTTFAKADFKKTAQKK